MNHTADSRTEQAAEECCLRTIERRLAEVEAQCLRDRRQLACLRSQLRAAAGIATVAVTFCAILSGTPQARADLAVAGASLESRVTALEGEVAYLRYSESEPPNATSDSMTAGARQTYRLTPVAPREDAAPVAFANLMSRPLFRTWAPIAAAVGPAIVSPRRAFRSAHIRVVFSR